MLDVTQLEREYDCKLIQIRQQKLVVPIYKTRRKSLESDLTFYATDPRDDEFVIYNNETLRQVMLWCEKQRFLYKYMPNCGDAYV